MVVQFFKDGTAYLSQKRESIEYLPGTTFLCYGGYTLDPFYSIKEAYYMDSAFSGESFRHYGG